MEATEQEGSRSNQDSRDQSVPALSTTIIPTPSGVSHHLINLFKLCMAFIIDLLFCCPSRRHFLSRRRYLFIVKFHFLKIVLFYNRRSFIDHFSSFSPSLYWVKKLFPFLTSSCSILISIRLLVKFGSLHSLFVCFNILTILWFSCYSFWVAWYLVLLQEFCLVLHTPVDIFCSSFE